MADEVMVPADTALVVNTLFDTLSQHVDAWKTGTMGDPTSPTELTFERILAKALSLKTRVDRENQVMLFTFQVDDIAEEIVPVWGWLTARRCDLRNWLEYRVRLFLTRAQMLLHCAALAQEMIAAEVAEPIAKNRTWWMPTEMGDGNDRPSLCVMVQRLNIGHQLNIRDIRTLLPWWTATEQYGAEKGEDCALVFPFVMPEQAPATLSEQERVQEQADAEARCAQGLVIAFEALCFGALMSATIEVLMQREDHQYVALAPVVVPFDDEGPELKEFLEFLFNISDENGRFRVNASGDGHVMSVIANALRLAAKLSTPSPTAPYPTPSEWWKACVNAAMKYQTELQTSEYVFFYEEAGGL